MNFKTKSNKVLKTFIQLLSERNFLTRHKWLCSDNTEFISYKYGPPGASLRNNLITNWREEIQFSKNYEPCFLVENYTLPILANNCNSLSSNSASLSQNVSLYSSEYVSRSLQMCACTLRQTNIKLPFTIAQIGVSYQSKNNENIFLFDSSEKTNLTLIHFCFPDSTQRTFEILLQQRLQWWQQFANVSSNFHLVQTKNTQNTKKNRDESFLFSGIQYHFPWGWNTIEKTTSLDAATYSLEELPICTTTIGTDAVDVLEASVVVSNVTLEKGLLALLYDSYQERIRKLPKNVKTKPVVTAATKSTGVLKLHSSLSPYKVGVAIYGKKTRHLRQLAQRVIKDLKTLDIQILGSADTASSLECQCIAYQQIGVLYIVLINDKSLETGLTRIINNNNNNDSKKEDEELVRVSDIKEHIYQNLKLASSHKT